MTVGRRIAAVLVTVALVLGASPATDAATDKTEVYIHSVFELFLGRSATGAEVSSWRSTVASGSRDVLTNALATSDEWAGTEVNNLFLKILRRPADASGRAYWVQTIKDGNRLEDIAAYFYGGPEYYQRVGSTTSAFVDNLYRDLLGRPSDGDGRSYWRSQIVAGMTRSEVASNFYASIESRTSRVRRLFQTILGRNPDPSGQAYWAEQLLTIGDVKLAAFLAASQEYYNRATKPAPTTTTTTTTTTTKPTTTTTTSTTTPPVGRVMPLGDSNTRGFPPEEGGYRDALENLLVGSAVSFDFVGSQTDGPGSLQRKKHEGHNGHTIGQVRAAIDGYLSADPDVVLLMVGTNDLKNVPANDGVVVADEVTELKGLIQRILSQEPGVKVIVSTLPPQLDNTGNARVQDFNGRLPAMISTITGDVELVQGDDAINRDTEMLDDLHPKPNGYQDLAGVWFHALT